MDYQMNNSKIINLITFAKYGLNQYRESHSPQWLNLCRRIVSGVLIGGLMSGVKKEIFLNSMLW